MPSEVMPPAGLSRASLRQVPAAGPRLAEKLPSKWIGAPSAPEASASWSARMLGAKRRLWPIARHTPASFAAAAARPASAAVSASGFSQKTCLPASAAARIWPQWRLCGVARTTASTSGSSSADR